MPCCHLIGIILRHFGYKLSIFDCTGTNRLKVLSCAAVLIASSFETNLVAPRNITNPCSSGVWLKYQNTSMIRPWKLSKTKIANIVIADTLFDYKFTLGLSFVLVLHLD